MLVLSASGTNALGRSSPNSGCSQRTSASTPRCAAPQVDLRLVVQDELAAPRSRRAARRSGRAEPGCDGRARRCNGRSPPARLRAVHRDLAAAQQRVAVGAVVRVQHDADAGLAVQRDALDSNGPRSLAATRRAAASAAASPDSGASRIANSSPPKRATRARRALRRQPHGDLLGAAGRRRRGRARR